MVTVYSDCTAQGLYTACLEQKLAGLMILVTVTAPADAAENLRLVPWICKLAPGVRYVDGRKDVHTSLARSRCPTAGQDKSV